MNIQGKCAIVTGAASGIGQAVAFELAERGARAVALVDRSEDVLKVARMINDRMETPLAEAMIGDTTDEEFRRKTFDLMCAKYGPPAVCVPAAGITRDQLAVKVDKQTGKAEIYPIGNFRQVLEVNLVAPVYWAMELIARIAEHRNATAWADGNLRKGSRGRSSSSARSRRRASPARSPTPPPRPPSKAPRRPWVRRLFTMECAAPSFTRASPTPRWYRRWGRSTSRRTFSPTRSSSG